MDAVVAEIIAAFHATSIRWSLALTGGGIRLGGWLLSVPGGSRTILEIHTPYDNGATDAYLGRRLESYCSPEAALALARRAYDRACWLAPRQLGFGLGLTASLRSDRPKKGEHRVYVAAATPTQSQVWSLTLTKDARSREDEDDLAARLALYALATTAGVAGGDLVTLLPGEVIHTKCVPIETPLARFIRREVPAVCHLPDGRQIEPGLPVGVIVPGSFNPLHAGHVSLAQIAAEMTGRPVAFELSVENVEKPPLGPAEFVWRAMAFRWRFPLWLTQSPRFLQKARLFPGAVFVVGADTAARLVEPRFYQDDRAQMQAALAEMRALGCRFLVAGRVEASGRFVSLNDLAIPAEFASLFEGIPESRFRVDLSSTALRQKS